MRREISGRFPDGFFLLFALLLRRLAKSSPLFVVFFCFYSIFGGAKRSAFPQKGLPV